MKRPGENGGVQRRLANWKKLAGGKIISEASKNKAAICLPGEYTPDLFASVQPASVS